MGEELIMELKEALVKGLVEAGMKIQHKTSREIMVIADMNPQCLIAKKEADLFLIEDNPSPLMEETGGYYKTDEFELLCQPLLAAA